MTTHIKQHIEDGVGVITFDKPERRNALTLEMFEGFGRQMEAWKTNDDVAVVMLTGGEDMFCAGLDLDLQSGFTEETRKLYSEVCLWAYQLILDYPKPTIAAVAGPTLGGGCDIAVFCDMRVGAKNTVMGFVQVKFGLTPYFSPLWKIVGLSQAKLLTFSGDKIDAQEAFRIGLIDRLVETGTVVEEAMKLGRSIAETTVKSAMINKEMALRSPAMDPISALAWETQAYREVIRHPDVNERIQQAFAKVRNKP